MRRGSRASGRVEIVALGATSSLGFESTRDRSRFALAELLVDVLGQRHREVLARGWPAVPELVFPNERGGPIDEHNFAVPWRRLQRRAQREGIRPLNLHATRHTWATLALASGKASVRWVADQLGHHSPEFTLRTYTHALRDEAPDLSFADFSLGDGAGTALGRRWRGAPRRCAPNAIAAPGSQVVGSVRRRPRLRVVTRARFERATPSFGGWCSIQAELPGQRGRN